MQNGKMNDLETGLRRIDNEQEEVHKASKRNSSNMNSSSKKTASTRRSLQQNNNGTVSFDDGMSASAASSEKSSILNLSFSWFSSTLVVVALIVILGSATSASFLTVGIRSAIREQENHFRRAAIDVVQRVEYQFRQYENAASIVHNYCRHRNFTREGFRELYEYIVNEGLDFKAVQFDPNITHADREKMENEARQYYAKNYPHVQYRGFVGFETEIPSHLEPRSEQPFYFPIHYMEPIPGNEAAIELDYYSHISRRQTLLSCMETGQPALTDRLVLVKDQDKATRCGAAGDASYGVVLMHPGVNLTTQPDVWPRDLSSIVICIPSLLRVSTQDQSVSSAVYIYDATDSSGDTKFLGGVSVDIVDENLRGSNNAALTYLPEVELEELKGRRLFFSEDVQVTRGKTWTAAVVALEGTYQPDIAFVILGAAITFVASLCVAAWVYTSARRIARFNEIHTAAEAEKAALILKSAREATKAERELNDFIGHEVRNPVAAAMAACSFVKTEVNRKEPLTTEESRESTVSDVDIIEKSLNFVNDLLRNMLDMHRAAHKQLKVNMAPTDLLHDVMEPVGGMLHQRGGQVKVVVECPSNIFVMADTLRLKQVLLNLGRNSAKFVERGFIKLRASKVGDRVEIYVEDSGPGVPVEKSDRLFNKYQESLDVLQQGTGIGLYLCKTLTELMDGCIYLDREYDSGVPNNPGARFVIDIKAAAMEQSMQFHLSDHVKHHSTADVTSSGNTSATTSSDDELPDQLSILFVDDSAVLRKLFQRSIRVVAPNWNFREAANGETALRLVETESFDLIFVDMYMASVEKQLLGTETVVELRRKNVSSRICGLSANDLESEFIQAGADSFLIKPFPCDPRLLTQELFRVLYEDAKMNENGKGTTYSTIEFER